MERILIMGCSGSGKSTLAKKMAKKLDMPLVHLDALGWKDDWQKVPQPEFDRMLLNEIKKPRWIIDGNHSRTLPLRLRFSDTVIFLDYSRMVCMWRIIKRVIGGFGKNRSDMGNNCRERFDKELLKRVWRFRADERDFYLKSIEGSKSVKTFVLLKNKKEAKEFLGNF